MQTHDQQTTLLYKVIPKGNHNGDYGYKVLRSGVDKALDNRALGPRPPKTETKKL